MELRHIVGAIDDSSEGRAALLAAARLAAHCGARITALTVIPPSAEGREEQVRRDLAVRVTAAVGRLEPRPRVDLAVAEGLPGVEISRYAETAKADLVVIGRKRRSVLQRLLLGDTADSVARRSALPCLFVSADEQRFERILVALDGTERGISVLLAAIDFSRLTGACIRVVNVEPAYQNEDGVPRILTARSARLAEVVAGLARRSDLAENAWDRSDGASGDSPLVIHRGPVVAEIIREVSAAKSDLLLVGYHRGGPVAVAEAGSVSRRLAHEAPCGVLTIPL